MQALSAVQSLKLKSWCIGAGAIRNAVWDHLHGFSEPSYLADVDVTYFDDVDMSPQTEQRIETVLTATFPQIPWEVTNQATVHRWFEQHFGHPVSALESLEQAVASWPEYATSVGVWLDQNASIQVIAPWGLEDLFQIRVRRNPTRVSEQTYSQRIEQKQYARRWPKVTIVS